ncbi:MAG: 16S rRNA (guanine(966)-N(2))-methyltransferase RsmD [Lachnospiraceae bacterium]|nr:16S rRNA (guanine(966)-N(2))-methyltransferase RsmD [Lachnospiraceae bacterium]
MRVIAGTARSLPLKTPEGRHTRPTTDRIKETLFNILQSRIPGCVFVDIFSGSGGIGIEALSRGAKMAYFLENDRNALRCISENLQFTGFEKEGILLSGDAAVSVARISESADIIFLDPPYGCGLEQTVLDRLLSCSCLTENTVLILEAPAGYDVASLERSGYQVTRQKKYKTNQHVFLQWEEK